MRIGPGREAGRADRAAPQQDSHAAAPLLGGSRPDPALHLLLAPTCGTHSTRRPDARRPARSSVTLPLPGAGQGAGARLPPVSPALPGGGCTRDPHTTLFLRLFRCGVSFAPVTQATGTPSAQLRTYERTSHFFI